MLIDCDGCAVRPLACADCVVTVLLAACLDAGLAGDDLRDIGTVVLARPEKAQRKTLLTHLAALPDDDVRRDLLELAAASDDAAFAAKARRLLRADRPGAGEAGAGAAVEAIPSAGFGVWELAPVGREIPPFARYAADAAGLDDLEISDLIHGAAFFNWANRLMLSIGRPVAPV